MATVIGSLKNVWGIRGVTYRFGELQKRSAFALNSAGNYLRLRARSEAARPEVAAVMVGRNDDYMSDFAERLYATIEWNVRYLIGEVIFVEWNPPPDRELLAYGLAKKFKSLRAYVVPPEFHDRICENSNVKLLEYHAKNVGIRRARSPWVMATNADAALAFDTINKVVEGPLSPNVAWTAQRFDIAWQEDRQRRLGLVGTLGYKRFNPYQRFGTGEFILASRELWHRTRGYDELLVKHRIGCDVRGTAQMVAHGATLSKAGGVLHLMHPTSCAEQIQPHHGESATIEGVPYYNPDNWGMADRREIELAERVWRLE